MRLGNGWRRTVIIVGAMMVLLSTGLLPPAIATPANLHGHGAGGYRFGAHWRLGLPIAVFSLLVSVPLVPLIWPFP